MLYKDKTKKVYAGKIAIGGDAPVSVQSMLNVKADNIEGNVLQAKGLEAAGCEIIRVSVPDMNSVKLIYALKEAVSDQHETAGHKNRLRLNLPGNSVLFYRKKK